MRKIPSLFVRDWGGDRTYVTREVDPACTWVIDGEGVATRKYDGTCMMFDGERWWARRDVRPGKIAPPGFIALETDPETGKTFGWEPVAQSSYARWHAEAMTGDDGETFDSWPAGTYELVGPKVNGDPEGHGFHTLIFHGYAEQFGEAPRDFDGLAKWLHGLPYEGIVWHHPDGRMCKIKKRDFRVPLEVPADA
jgi:Family of unknown function (DUF5565)